MPPLPPFLTVAGVEVLVDADSFREQAPTVRGDATRAFDGTLVSTVSAQKRSWTGNTAPLTVAERTALRTAAGVGVRVACGGWALGLAPGATLTAVVTLGETTYVPNDTADGLGAAYVVAFTVTEA